MDRAISKDQNDVKQKDTTRDSTSGNVRHTKDEAWHKVAKKGRAFDSAQSILPDVPFRPIEPEKPKPTKR
jgi:hypothetical protein